MQVISAKYYKIRITKLCIYFEYFTRNYLFYFVKLVYSVHLNIQKQLLIDTL